MAFQHSAPAVLCFFCKARFVAFELESHMREKHQMMNMFQLMARVKCIFCMEEIEEKEMESHIRLDHRIVGLHFNFDQADTSTQTQSQAVSTDWSINESFVENLGINEKGKIEDIRQTVSGITAKEVDTTIERDIHRKPSLKMTTVERYRCSSCDFHHNRINFLKRHIRIVHKDNVKQSYSVRQNMKVMMRRKPIEKVMKKERNQKNKTDNRTSKTNVDVEILPLDKCQQNDCIKTMNDETGTNSEIEILSVQLSSHSSHIKLGGNERSSSKQTQVTQITKEDRRAIDKENHKSHDKKDQASQNVEECLFCNKKVEKSKLETHIREEHKIGLTAAVAKLLDIHNKKNKIETFTAEQEADIEETNQLGNSFSPVLDEIADNEDLVNRISSSAPAVLDQVYLPENQAGDAMETSSDAREPSRSARKPSRAAREPFTNNTGEPSSDAIKQSVLTVARFRCTACQFHNRKIYLVIEHILDLHQEFKKVEKGNMHPVKQEMKIFLEKIRKKKTKILPDTNIVGDSIHSDSEPEIELTEEVGVVTEPEIELAESDSAVILDYNTKESLSIKNNCEKNKMDNIEKGKSASGTPIAEDDDCIQVVYESIVNKPDPEKKKKNVTFSFNEINSFYRCKKKPKENPQYTSFSILKNDSILNKAMKYWASKNKPKEPSEQTVLRKPTLMQPFLLDPGLCDDISLTIIGVRFRCPSCLFADEKLRVVREHIIEAHQGFHLGEVDQFVDYLEPIRHTMRVRMLNVSQMEIDKITKEYDKKLVDQNSKNKNNKSLPSKKKKMRLEDRIFLQQSKIVQKCGVNKAKNDKFHCYTRLPRQEEDEQHVQTKVPEKHSTSESQLPPATLDVDTISDSSEEIKAPKTAEDTGEVCQVVTDNENSWKDHQDAIEAEISRYNNGDDLEQSLFLEGDDLDWNKSLFDRLSMSSRSNSSGHY